MHQFKYLSFIGFKNENNIVFMIALIDSTLPRWGIFRFTLVCPSVFLSHIWKSCYSVLNFGWLIREIILVTLFSATTNCSLLVFLYPKSGTGPILLALISGILDIYSLFIVFDPLFGNSFLCNLWFHFRSYGNNNLSIFWPYTEVVLQWWGEGQCH